MANVRAAAHVHSDWSYDGTWPLANIARAFARRRYGVVLMAEHDRGFDEDRWAAYRRACVEASGDRILLVPGIEYSDRANTVHVAVWGDLPFLGEGRDTGDLLREVERLGGLAVLTHPGRRGAWTLVEEGWGSALLGLELWNRKYDGWIPNEDATRALENHRELIPFVSLDFHKARQFFPLAMVLDVDGPVTVESVIEAMEGRRCRPQALRLPALRLTSGPELLAARGGEICRRMVSRALGRAVQTKRGRPSWRLPK